MDRYEADAVLESLGAIEQLLIDIRSVLYKQAGTCWVCKQVPCERVDANCLG